jgi:predicted transcriptional regulator YdeE
MFTATLRNSANLALPLILILAATGFAQSPAAPAPSQTASAPTASGAPKIEDRNAFIVVGITVRTNNAKEASGQGEIPQLWQNAMQNNTLDAVPNKADDSLIVVYSDYATDNTGDYNYTLGYRVTSADKIPAGMVSKTVHAGKYAVLTSEQGAPQQVVPALWQRINTMTPQQLGGARAYESDFETYGNIVDWGNMQMTAHIGLK